MARSEPPFPDRLAAVRAYALQRSAQTRSRDNIAAILRRELPELAQERAHAIADMIATSSAARLADAFAERPDDAAAVVVAFAFGGLA